MPAHTGHENKAKNRSEMVSRRSAQLTAEPMVQPLSNLTVRRAQLDANALQAEDILALQRTVGNAVVQRLLAGTRTARPQLAQFVRVAGPRLDAPPAIQTQLRVGAAGDKYEEEAEQFSRRIVGQVDTPARPPVRSKGVRQGNDEESGLRNQGGDMKGMVRTKPISQAAGVRRAVGPEGGDLDNNLTARIRQSQNGASSLPAGVRNVLEPKLGADLSGVKVHTGSHAVQLNRELGAKAFTHKNHIFYGAGQSPSDLQLTAHETVHTIQQGGVQRQWQGDRENVTPNTPSISRAPADKVQRLMTSKHLKWLAGGPSAKAERKNSTYTQILQRLDEYHVERERYKQAKNAGDKKAAQKRAKKILKKLISLADKWIGRHSRTQGYGDARVAKDRKDARKLKFIEALKVDLQHEKGYLPDLLEGKAPSWGPGFMSNESDLKELKKYETQGEQVSQAAGNLTAEKNTKYQFSVLAAIEEKDYLDFAEARLRITLAEKAKGKKGMSSAKIKEAAATKVIADKYFNNDLSQLAELLKKVKKLVASSGRVGHTWIKLSRYDRTKNSLIDEQSFGFWPLTGYSDPKAPTAGRVRSPDVAHEYDTDLRRKDFDITFEEYQKAMAEAGRMMASPPDYTLIDFNCTKFALHIAQKINKSFPPNAFMRVPKLDFGPKEFIDYSHPIKSYKDLQELKTKLINKDEAYLGKTVLKSEAYNPNALYAALEKGQGAYEPNRKLKLTPTNPSDQVQEISVEKAARVALAVSNQHEVDRMMKTNAKITIGGRWSKRKVTINQLIQETYDQILKQNKLDPTTVDKKTRAEALKLAKAHVREQLLEEADWGVKTMTAEMAFKEIGKVASTLTVKYLGDGKTYTVPEDKYAAFMARVRGLVAYYQSES